MLWYFQVNSGKFSYIYILSFPNLSPSRMAHDVSRVPCAVQWVFVGLSKASSMSSVCMTFPKSLTILPPAIKFFPRSPLKKKKTEQRIWWVT